ncbi:hypothetical protein Tco_1022950 [Tanacetum coccineum]
MVFGEVQAQICRIFLDGYGILVVRIVIFKYLRLSSRMRYLHGINDAIKVTLFDVIIRLIPVSINTKFLNCLQPGWSKHVTMVRHNQTGDTVSYDVLYDSVVEFEPHVLASKANKAAKNHDPLALLAQSNASSSQSHANSSYLPQLYYVTHPSSVVDYEDKYQGDLQGDSQEVKLTTAMMMVELIYKPRMQVLVEMVIRMQGDRTGIQHLMQERVNSGKGNYSINNGRVNCCSHVDGQIQPDDGNAETVLSYDAKAVSEVNASSKVHEQAFKDRENRYLEDIIDLEEKLSSHDRIVYKMGQSTQTIHMLGKKPNKVYDLFLKAGLCYKNPERLKKAIAAQPKMYDGEMLHSAKLKIDSPDLEETLEDAEESRLKMRNKMV